MSTFAIGRAVYATGLEKNRRGSRHRSVRAASINLMMYINVLLIYWYIETERLSGRRLFCYLLHTKLSLWQHLVQPMMKRSSSWRPFHFNVISWIISALPLEDFFTNKTVKNTLGKISKWTITKICSTGLCYLFFSLYDVSIFAK